jgi:N-formylglutamate deformylase
LKRVAAAIGAPRVHFVEARPVQTLFNITVGDGPLVAAAIHHGHALRPALAEHMTLDEATRLREEDPFTGELAELVPTHFVGGRSRFEMDLNRPREQAVYQKPEDVWGLSVWQEKLPAAAVAESLANYDLFYKTVHTVLHELVCRHGRVVVLDLHSYNHCHDGEGCVADVATNPEVNVGTGSIDRSAWGPIVERFIADLRGFDFLGRPLDVRENVKFFGGHFPRWIHTTFRGQACAIAVEFKKTFMDEWTGELYRPHFVALQTALRSTFPGLLEVLRECEAGHM